MPVDEPPTDQSQSNVCAHSHPYQRVAFHHSLGHPPRVTTECTLCGQVSEWSLTVRWERKMGALERKVEKLRLERDNLHAALEQIAAAAVQSSHKRAGEQITDALVALEGKEPSMTARLVQDYQGRAEAAEADVRRLERWVDDLQSGLYVNCVYCGHNYGPSTSTPVSMADVLKEHIEQCPKHPMSALKAEVERLRPLVALADDMAKSLHDRERDVEAILAPLDWLARYDAAKAASEPASAPSGSGPAS